MTESLREACGAIDALQGKLDGLVRVAVVTTSRNAGPHLFCKHLAVCTQKSSLKQLSPTRSGVIEKLETHHIDIALMGRPPQRIEVGCNAVCQTSLCLIGHPDHPLNKLKWISRKELTKHPFLLREEGSGNPHGA